MTICSTILVTELEGAAAGAGGIVAQHVYACEKHPEKWDRGRLAAIMSSIVGMRLTALDGVLLPESNGIIKQSSARSSLDAQAASIVSGGLLVEKTNKRRRNGAGEDVGWLAKHAMQALDRSILVTATRVFSSGRWLLGAVGPFRC